MNDSRECKPRHEADDIIVVECDLPEPPEKVWRALTEPALVAEWLAPDETPAGECRPIESEIIEARPHRLIRYSWRETAPSADHQSPLDSIVTFELARTPAGGTHLRIIHTAFEQTPALAMAA